MTSPSPTRPDAIPPEATGRGAAYLSALRHRNFALVWFGQTVSELGNGAYQVALSWAVYAVTGSTVDLGLVLAANAIPKIALFLFGGVIGDRLPRRTVILTADLASAAVTTVLALLAAGSGLSLAVLLAGSAALGITGSLYGPAYGAIVPDVLPAEKLLHGNALLAASTNMARVGGPVFAGILYAVGGASLAFGLDAASFAVSALCTALTVIPRARALYRGTLGGDLRQGLGYAARTRWLQLVMAIAFVANGLCVAPLFVLLPEIVKGADGGPRSLGLAMAVQMAVATAVSLAIPKVRRIGGSALTLAGLAAVLGIGVVMVGLARSVPLLLVGMAVIGVGFGFDVVESTIVQSAVPRAMLARVYSLMLVVSFALLPVGYAVSGAIAQRAGTTVVMLFAGLSLVFVAVSAMLGPPLRSVTVAQEATEAQEVIMVQGVTVAQEKDR